MDFSKTKVASAAVNHSKLDLSSNHITTGSFLNLQPVYYRHMIPGEHISGVGSMLSRLAPVAVPTYGRCRVNLRAFFVPFRCVFPNFNEFIVDTIANNVSTSSLVSGSPIINNDVFISYFTTATYQNTPVSVSLDPNNHADAAIISDDRYDFESNGIYYVLSYRGRQLMKLIRSLGYKVIFDNTQKDFQFSALPLLCMAKVYLDWYANSSYANNVTYLYVQRLLKYNDPSAFLSLNQADLSQIMNLLGHITYDSGNDVYLNAWDTPMSPNQGNFSSRTISDISALNQTDSLGTSSPTSIGMMSNGTPKMVQNSSSQVDIGTTFIHQALKSLTDYMKRNQLSGAYAVDRFLARFGINLDSAKVDRSIYVGASSIDINFGDVMQTVNNAPSGQPSNLGDYAGQGFGKGNLEFDFKCDEFGLFLVTYSIIPVAHLFQGFDRNLLHINKDSFYTPEFDNLGCSAIAKGEVYVSKNDSFATNTQYLGIFGFAPRYYEYKQKQDFVTGDFDSPYVMAGGSAWHLNRIFDDSSFNNTHSDLVHSFGFTQGIDNAQYDRIFQYAQDDIDKFYLVFNFSVEGLSPCKSLFDTYKFDELGQQLTMDTGGAKVN